MPWKRRILAVLRDLNLVKYIDKAAALPTPTDPRRPTKEEEEAIEKWQDGDARTRTRIELAIGDSEMIHISGAHTAREMWEQLSMVKESKGRLGVLATRRAMYRATAQEGFEMVEHVSNLRRLQEELHIMGSLVSDEDFVMILLTSLPESWDNYTTSFLGSTGNTPTVRSHELVALLFEEDRRRKTWNGESSTALHARHNAKTDKSTECYNCHKKGHVSADCWSKGGGKEGQGPKGRKKEKKGGYKANHAEEVNTNLNDCAYMVSAPHHSHEFTRHDWLLDSATTSHICTIREAFVDFKPVSGESVKGVGPLESPVVGRGTVVLVFEFDGQTVKHDLHNTLYVPSAPNSLLSVGRFDDTGGKVEFDGGTCWMKNKAGKKVGKGFKHQRLYLLAARTAIPRQERANFAAAPKLTWDQWHRRYGHIGITALKQLDKE